MSKKLPQARISIGNEKRPQPLRCAPAIREAVRKQQYTEMETWEVCAAADCWGGFYCYRGSQFNTFTKHNLKNLNNQNLNLNNQNELKKNKYI